MTKIDAFKGFTPATIQFFKDLEANNYKEWFEEHRGVYEKELLNPFKQLVTALSPVMYNIDPRFELRPHRVLSRIYRDIRFSKNKSPYKNHMWMTFQAPVQAWENYPGFFMELSAEGYNYGMGLYMAKKKVMDDFRDRLEYDAAEFEKNTQKNVLERGFQICGEDYKKPLENNLPVCFQPWYQKKSVYVWKTLPIGDEVFGPHFADVLREDFEALTWLYNFMKEE
ncbi:DUF2461 domain-containing protein [Viscerimonas tarda]